MDSPDSCAVVGWLTVAEHAEAKLHVWTQRMANLRDEGEEGVSLFPLFDVLACTLGVVVFILKQPQAVLAPVLQQLAGSLELRLTPVKTDRSD